MLPTKPTCCLLTHSGRGAVAVVGLVGKAAAISKINDQLFAPIGSRSFQHLIDHSDQEIFYGQWKSTAEDLVVIKTERGLEVHCHGGDAASAAVINDLNQTGCESVSKQQWRLLHGDQWQSETEAAICEAATVRTANILLRVLQNQPAALSKLAAQIKNQQITKASRSIEQALAWADFGENLTRPRSVVFCGRPNVGKSSLVNAIAGFQRAIVNSRAGTTRDVLSQSTAINGWPVQLKDTAGLRASQDRIEALGIEKAKQEIIKSQIRCLVFSCEDFQGSEKIDESALEKHQRLLLELDPQLVVFNKSDLVPNFKPPADLKFSGPKLVVSAADASATDVSATDVSATDVSATGVSVSDNNTGLQNLVDSIAHTLVPELPPKDQWFAVSQWQRTQLQLMLQQLTAGDFEAAQSSLRRF